jgi:hypothetical protein
MGHKLDQDLSESLQGPRVPGSYHQKSAGSKVGESSAYIRQKKKQKKILLCMSHT